MSYLLTSLDKASSPEENDTMIVKFGSWNIVIFKFRLIFCDRWAKLLSGKDFHKVFWGSPLIRGKKKKHGSMGFHKTPYRRLFPRHNSSLIGRKTRAKFENDCISWNWHIESKLLNQLQWSWHHSLLRKLPLYLMMYKNIALLSRKVLKIHRSAFFFFGGGGGDRTPGITGSRNIIGSLLTRRTKFLSLRPFKYKVVQGSILLLGNSWDNYVVIIGVRPMGLRGAAAPPRIFHK